MQKGWIIFSIVLVVLNLYFSVAAEYDVSISNSDQWQDVYSTMLLAGLDGEDSEFLVSTSHGPILLNGIGRENDILVVTSKDSPYVFNYPSMIENEDFASVEEIVVESANLELVDEVPSVNNFIVVGNDFGYNAIAVVQYAKATNSWVFLADRANIDEIDRIISNRNVNDVLIYGYVDREVRDTLLKYDPEIINTGDKFKDNIAIFEKFGGVGDVEQVVLTNGEFIEKEIMLGRSAILFTGRENVPDQIRDYIKGSDVKIGVLIGNDLIGAATNIKRTAGIDVIAKFARGARGNTGGAVAAVEGLDLFYLPSPRLDLAIYSIKYNKATSLLEVTYQSNSNVPGYFKGTITIDSNGERKVTGDLDTIFIAPGDYKTVAYEGISGIDEDDVVADVYTLYGETPSALDRILQGRYEVDIVNVIDACQMEIVSVVYNKQKEQFYVKVKNEGGVDCWIDIEFRDIIINDFETTIGSDEARMVRAGKSEKIYIEQRMDEEDLKDNSIIEVHGYYGQRRESLVNEIIQKLEIKVQTFSVITWLVIALVILIILLIIIAFIYKRREEDF